MSFDYDYFVIGGGSGGVRSARVAALHGARVALAEERALGGTCVNAGCVPKKLMCFAARVANELAEAQAFGWSVGAAEFHWETFLARKDREIARLNEVYGHLLEGAGCTLLGAHASFVDAHTLQVGSRTITADKILIATGSWPHVPSEPGVKEHAITSNEAFHLPRLPKRLVIVGGGYIAVEFAGIFNGFGARVSALHRGPLFMRGFDDDVRQALAEEMAKRGVDLRHNTAVTRLEKTGDCLLAHLDDGSTIACDQVLYATGRRPHVEGLGLDRAGVRTNARGAIDIDEGCRTNVENIYAIGDVTDGINLTPMAIAKGHALADTLFGAKPRRVSEENVPSAVFSDPPVATVGLSEAKAKKRFGQVDVYRSRFRPLRSAFSGSEGRTLMKLVVDHETDRVLGCHMVGVDAPEIMQGFAAALNCGVTKAQLDATLGIHPTSAEELVTMSTLPG